MPDIGKVGSQLKLPRGDDLFGKLVSAGVYFYVIRATGSDGKKYKLSGDINILRYERRDSGGGTMDEPVE